MEDISIHSLLVVTPEEKQKIQTFFEINDERVLESNIDAIAEWCKKEDHLVNAFQYINRNVIERLLVLSKGSVEAAKIKIDKFITTRGIFPELIANKSYEEFEKFLENIIVVPLSTLHPMDQTRCTVVQFRNGVFDENTLLTWMRFSFMLAEFRLFHDEAVADVYVVDVKHITVGVLTKINPMILKKAETLGTEAYGYKIKRAYFLNAPPFIDKILSIIKPFLKEKVARRIQVLSSYEDLYNDFSRELLPEDYGGCQPSLANQMERWKEFLRTEESRKLINNSDKITSDESKRSCYKFNEQYLGMPGTFRQLTVD